MKRIRLLSVPDPKFPLGSDGYEANCIVYRLVVEQCIRVPLDRQTGASIEEMRKAIRVLDALDRSGEVLELEDADWEFLKQKVEHMPWAVIDRRIVQFHDDVVEATEAIREPAMLGNGVAVA